MEHPWKTDKWFVSPWNVLPAAQKGKKFSPKIKIHEVTPFFPGPDGGMQA